MSLPNPQFEQSYTRMFGHGIGMAEGSDDFFRAFYDRFLKHPEVATLFAETDLTHQVAMLKRSMFHLVSYYVVGGPTAELDRLGRIHQQLGISAALFDIWLRALVDTVAQFDPEFDERTELAWCWALSPGIAYLQLVMMDAVYPADSSA